MEEQHNGHYRPSNRKKARAARLFAVQAIYALDVSKTSSPPSEVLNYYLNGDAENINEIKPDHKYLSEIFYSAIDNHEQINEIITGSLSSEWKIDRLDKLLKAILAAGISELLSGSMDAKLIISEYVKITDSFYSQRECNFINKVLDSVARKLKLI